jgi:hypothetical protein
MDERIRTDSDFGPAVRRDIGEPASVAIAPWPGIEQSLASVTLGGIFALMAFPTFLMIHVLGQSHFNGWARGLVIIAGILGTVGGLFVVACTVFGLIFGILGMGAARRSGRSAALGLAGVLLNSLDLFMWIGALAGWLGTVADRL